MKDYFSFFLGLFFQPKKSMNDQSLLSTNQKGTGDKFSKGYTILVFLLHFYLKVLEEFDGGGVGWMVCGRVLWTMLVRIGKIKSKLKI